MARPPPPELHLWSKFQKQHPLVRTTTTTTTQSSHESTKRVAHPVGPLIQLQDQPGCFRFVVVLANVGTAVVEAELEDGGGGGVRFALFPTFAILPLFYLFAVFFPCPIFCQVLFSPTSSPFCFLQTRHQLQKQPPPTWSPPPFSLQPPCLNFAFFIHSSTTRTTTTTDFQNTTTTDLNNHHLFSPSPHNSHNTNFTQGKNKKHQTQTLPTTNTKKKNKKIQIKRSPG